MPQRGGPGPLPTALAPLPDKGGRVGVRRHGPGWRGEMEAQPPARPRGRLGKGADWGAFVFGFCCSSPIPTRTQTHRHTQVLLRLGFFPALAQYAACSWLWRAQPSEHLFLRHSMEDEGASLLSLLLL